MNGRMTKMLRRQARKESAKRDQKILPELKDWINNLIFKDRLRVAWRIVCGKF